MLMIKFMEKFRQHVYVHNELFSCLSIEGPDGPVAISVLKAFSFRLAQIEVIDIPYPRSRYL